MTLSRLHRNCLTPPLLLVALLLGACSGDSPESMLASARDYLAKRDNKAAVIQIKNALQKNPDYAEARHLLGRTLLETGDAVGAEVELRKALALKHPPEQTVPLLARALLAQGQSKKLLDELAKVQMSSPEAIAEVQTALASAQADAGRTSEANAALAAAFAAKPDHGPALLVKARMAVRGGDLQAALAIVDQVLRATPADAEALKMRGDLLLVLRDPEQAIAEYRKAIEARPEFVLAHASLIGVLLDQGRSDDAARQIEDLKKAAPRHALAAYLEARLAYVRKDFPKARDFVLQFLRVAPDQPLGVALAGAIEFQSGAFAQAELHFSKLVRLLPGSVDARRQLAATYLRLGQPARARQALEPVLDRIDQDSNTLSLAGEAALQTGDLPAAERYFSKAAALDPKSVRKRTALALAHLAKGNEAAFAELEQIAAQDAGTQADLALIAAAMRKGQTDKALKFIDALQKKMPDSPVPHQLRGSTLLSKRDAAGARQSFAKAAATSAAYFPAAAALAALDFSEKKPADAAKRFEAVIAADPKSFEAYLALAEVRSRAGAGPDEVAALLAKAVAANPNETTPRLALIQFHMRAKDTKKALATAQDAVAALPDRFELLEVLARVHQAAGDANQALKTFQKMAALQPASPVPHLRSAEIHLAGKSRDAATASLRKALEIRPDLLEAQRGLVALGIEAGAGDQALAVARDVQKQRPKEAVGYLLEGDVHAAGKAWKEATAAYRHALRMTPNEGAAARLHMALHSSGAKDEAQRFAAGWLKDNPRDFAFRIHLGDRAVAENRPADAAGFYKPVVEAQPSNILALNNLAWAAAQQKDPQARSYAERAYRLAPENPAVMDTLAMILLDKGEGKRAVELLRAASGKAPEALVIRLNLARALVRTGDKEAARKEVEALEKLGDKGLRKDVLDQLRKEL